MVLNGSKYLFLSLASAGVVYFFWLANQGAPIDPNHVTLSTKEEILSHQETLVGHYSNKLSLAPSPESDEEIHGTEKLRVFLQETQAAQPLLESNLSTEEKLKLVASIDSPVFDGLKLQASVIEIFPVKVTASEKRTLIFIGHNMVGPKNLGGIQVISISEKSTQTEQNQKGKKAQEKNETKYEIKILQTALFKDCEIHDLAVMNKNDQSYLLAAGQTNAKGFKTPSFLEVLPLENGLIKETPSIKIDLPSYAATSVLFAHDKIITATGDHDGGIVLLDDLTHLNPGIYFYQDLPHQFHELQDTRDLAANNHSIYAISGGQSNLWSLRLKGEGRMGMGAHTKALEGGLIPEAKSSIKVTPNLAYIGLGDGGTQVFDLNSMEKVGEIPQLELNALDSSLTVTNAIYINNKELLTADGEGGSRLFELKSPTTLQQVAHIQFGEKTSVNSIHQFEDFYFFATGLGGVKVVHHQK